jgi:hypothetical protein
MGDPLAPETADTERDRQKVKPNSATLEAEYQRSIATGWLYLVDMTSDKGLRTSYEKIARHHLQLADAQEKRASDPGRPGGEGLRSS